MRVLLDTPSSDPTVNAARIQAGIDQVALAGGGRVTLGVGVWPSTTIFLRDRVELHLASSAVLETATDLSLFPRVENPFGNKDQEPCHLVFAQDCEDAAITGEGSIDGRDMDFWDPCTEESERPYGLFDFQKKPAGRPLPLVQNVRCRGLRVEGITIRRAPGWALHCYDCDRVTIKGVRIRSHLSGPNTDGIGITDCRDVLVHGCDATCGDDAFVVKSFDPRRTCERILISGCVAETRCAAFALGAETAGVLRDVRFEGCFSRAALRMIQVELWMPGLVEGIRFQGIAGRTFPGGGATCERAIYVDIQQFDRGEPVLGKARDLIFSDIRCRTRGRIVLTAQDGTTIDGVTLRDVTLDVPEIEDPALVVPKARSMQNSNFNPESRAARAAIVADNVQNLLLENISVHWPETPQVPMQAVFSRRSELRFLHCEQLLPTPGGE